MSINDMLASGVAIQGKVWVGRVGDIGETVYFDGEVEWYNDIPDDWADFPITYMFANGDVMRIEVEVPGGYY